MINLKTATALALALGLGTGAAWLSDAQAAGQQGSAGQATQSTASPASAQDFRQRADELIDRNIVNQKGEQIGELDDLVTDQSGKMFGVVTVGDVAGIGGKEVLIPVDQLRIGEDNLTLMSQQNEEQLKAMPEYDESKYKSVREAQSGGGMGTGTAPGTSGPGTGTSSGSPSGSRSGSQ